MRFPKFGVDESATLRTCSAHMHNVACAPTDSDPGEAPPRAHVDGLGVCGKDTK